MRMRTPCCDAGFYVGFVRYHNGEIATPVEFYGVVCDKCGDAYDFEGEPI